MKTTRKTKKRGSRPEKKIDWAKVDEYLKYQCKGTEIAAAFNMHPDTFYKKVEEKFKIGFTEYSAQKRDLGRVEHRKSQFELSKTNAAISIWWGKQYNDQREPENNRIVEEVEIPQNIDSLTDKQADELFEKLIIKK